MTILVSKKELKSARALLARRAYLQQLLAERRSTAGPSSQEWVSDERWAGTRQLLRDEIAEIDVALKRLRT